jgi:hypothetical protein
MSDSIEKKVLKEMLVKLKAKLIESQRMFTMLSLGLSSSSVQDLKSALEATLKMPDGQPKTNTLLLIAYLNTWNSNVNMVNITTASLIQDMNLYIETLERYSTELDSTLNGIFEKAREYARTKEEEERKQQEELRKRKPDYTS